MKVQMCQFHLHFHYFNFKMVIISYLLSYSFFYDVLHKPVQIIILLLLLLKGSFQRRNWTPQAMLYLKGTRMLLLFFNHICV